MSIFRTGYVPKTLSNILPYFYYTTVAYWLQPNLFHLLWCCTSMTIFRHAQPLPDTRQRLFLRSVLFSEFGRALPHIFFEFQVEIVHIFIAHLLGNGVYLGIVPEEQTLCLLNAHMVHIGVEALAHLLGEDFAQIGVVVAEQGSDALQGDVLRVVVVDVVEDIVQNAVPVGGADGGHHNLKPLGQKAGDFVQEAGLVNAANQLGVGIEGNVAAGIQAAHLLLDLQMQIGEEELDGLFAV